MNRFTGNTRIVKVHTLPGRLRLRLSPVPDKETLHVFGSNVSAHEGVNRVFTSHRTGSLLVYYQPDRILPDGITDLLKHAATKRPEETEDVEHPASAGRVNLGITLPGMVLRSFLPPWIRLAFAVKQAWPFLTKGARSLYSGKMNIDVLDGLAIGISLARRDLRAVMIITTLLSIAEYLEQWTRKRSMDQLAGDLLHLPPEVWVKHNDQFVSRPITAIKTGDLVVVRSGGRIPVDGIAVEGEAMVNQSSLTGEPLAVPKYPGISLFAGTVVEEGSIILRAEQVGDDTRARKIVRVLEQSERLKAGLQSRAEQWSDKVVPITIGISLLTLILTSNTNRAVSVLLVDFSCAIKLSTPLTMLSAMYEASKMGVLIKGGRYLEKLEQADTYVFDKTGTLTEAHPWASEIIPFGGHSAREVLRIAACLEEHFPHPVARAVVDMADREGLSHKEDHAEPEHILAHGIASWYKEQRVMVGSRHFMKQHGAINLDPAAETVTRAAKGGSSMLFVAIESELAGVILFEDPIRQDAPLFLSMLRRSGVKRIAMLTGDGDESAAVVARQLNLDDYQSQMLPEDKVRVIKELQSDGNVVAMVGDGINDTLALSAADVGISMKSGADITHEVCDVLLTRTDLDTILTARYISGRAMSRLRWNYAAVIGINSSLILLGIVGRITPSASALLHNLTTVLVTAGSLRPTGARKIVEKERLRSGVGANDAPPLEQSPK